MLNFCQKWKTQVLDSTLPYIKRPVDLVNVTGLMSFEQLIQKHQAKTRFCFFNFFKFIITSSKDTTLVDN